MKVGDLIKWTGIDGIDIGIVIAVDRFQPNWVKIRWCIEPDPHGTAMFPINHRCLEVINEVLR